jgi:glycerol uptake facilitator protein
MYQNLLGELVGTCVLVVFGDGVVANVLLNKSKGQNSGWMVIVTGWAMAVIMGVFTAKALGAVQADINPAVTIAKLCIGIYPLQQALATMAVEIAGGFAGGCLVYFFYKNHFDITDDADAKLGIFCTAPAIRSYGRNFFCEMFGTIVLVFIIFSIFSKQVGDIAAGFGPYLVGMLVWAIGLSLGGATGYAINPARDLGPRIAHALLPIKNKRNSDWGYAWVPVLGPIFGAVIAFVFVRLAGLI